MPDDRWIRTARDEATKALIALSAEGAVLERQLLRWLLGTPADRPRPPRDHRVLTRTRVRATRTLPHGTSELIDVLLFLHALDAEPEFRRDDLLDAWMPYVAAVLSGEEAHNPTLEHPSIPVRGRALAAVVESMKRFFRIGFYWWEQTGIPRRWLIQAPGAQRARLARYVLSSVGGFRPIWSNHLPQLPPGKHFTEDAFLHAHLEAAHLLQHAPGILGIASASWYYDPALEEFSPHLGFLHRTVAANGGILFPIPEEPYTREHALAGSRSRRAAAESGRYVPRNFARIWGRRAFLAWAERQGGWQLPLAINA